VAPKAINSPCAIARSLTRAINGQWQHNEFNILEPKKGYRTKQTTVHPAFIVLPCDAVEPCKKSGAEPVTVRSVEGAAKLQRREMAGQTSDLPPLGHNAIEATPFQVGNGLICYSGGCEVSE